MKGVASMNVTSSRGDFLPVAAIVEIHARASRADAAGPTPAQLRMQRRSTRS